LVTRGRARELDLDHGPPLGVVATLETRPEQAVLPDEDWTLFLYSDGLVEGYAGATTSERFGVERLAAYLAGRPVPVGAEHVDELLRVVAEANAGGNRDDLVVLALSAR